MGTALAVSPFNMIVDSVNPSIPKVLINLENTLEHGFEFDNQEKYPRRLFIKGKCDDVVQEIAEYCGFSDELKKRSKNETK